MTTYTSHNHTGTSAPKTPPPKDKLKLRAVYSLDGEFIPLQFIESINDQYKDPEEVTLEKLKDDYVVRIRTLSGREYNVSMSQMMARLSQKDEFMPIKDTDDMWEIVFESWMENIKG